MSNIPPSSSEALAASNASQLSLQAYADSVFISETADAIANAVAQGLFSVVLTTFQDCSISNIQAYLLHLGYTISYPDFGNPNLSPNNPAQLFGQAYVDFWANNKIINQPSINPARMKIEWAVPGPPPVVREFIAFVPEYSSLSWNQSLIFPFPNGSI